MAAAARERVLQRAAAARANAGEQLQRDAVAKAGAGQSRLGASLLRDRDRAAAAGVGEMNSSPPPVPWNKQSDNWSNRADDSLSSTAASTTGATAARRDPLSNSGGKSMGNVKDIMHGLRNKEPRHSEPLPRRSLGSTAEDLDATQRIEGSNSAASSGPPAQQARSPLASQVGTSQWGGMRGQDSGSGGYSGNSDAASSTFGKGGYPPQQTAPVPEGPMPNDSVDGFDRRPRPGFAGQQAGGIEEDEGTSTPRDRALSGSVFFPSSSGGTQPGQMRGGALAAMSKASQSQSVVFGHMGEARRGGVGAGGSVYSPRNLDNAGGGSGSGPGSAEINKSHQSVKGPQSSPSASLGEAVGERRTLNALSGGSHHLPAGGNARGAGMSRGPATAAGMTRGVGGAQSAGNVDNGGLSQTQPINRMAQRGVMQGRGSVVGRADVGAGGSRPGAGDPGSGSLAAKVGMQQPGRSGVGGLQSRGNALNASGGQAAAQDGARNVGQSPPRHGAGSALMPVGTNAGGAPGKSFAGGAGGGRPGGTTAPISMRPGLAAGGGAARPQQAQFSRACPSGAGGMRSLQQSQGLGPGAYARR